MNDKREFKINLDAGDSDDDFKVSRPEKKHAKSSVRYTPSLAVLFAFMALGITLAWMYYHFSTRLDDMNMEGSSGIASLSSEFTQNLSGMSEQLIEQKQATQKLLTDLENQVTKLKSSVSSLKTGKADIKDVDAAVNGIKKTITPFQGSVAQLEKQLNEINRKTESVATSLKQIENSASKNAADISKLNENAIDKSYIDQQIQKEREFQQNKLSVSSESLLKDIASLETKISNMKQRLVTVESQLSKKSAMPDKMPSSTTRKPAGNLSTPKAGEILEQDLE
jgi:predicted  nucleic acid-binding Zn-ribbon protein